LYPGNYATLQCLQPTVLKMESSFDLAPEHRKRTLYRLDGGSGTDKNLIWLVDRGYQILAKGFSAKRAHALARRVIRWDQFDEGSFIGRAMPTFDLGQPFDLLVRKRFHKGKWRCSYYVTTLSFPSKRDFMLRYNQRGSAEIEQFRTDKSGLHLSARRKQNFAAQKALILLTDLVHNLIADFRHRGLGDSRFADWGAKRIIRDLFAIQGRVYLVDSQVKRINLLASHPYTDELIICLERYCSGRFDSNFE
jgi:hypothetical protein